MQRDPVYLPDELLPMLQAHLHGEAGREGDYQATRVALDLELSRCQVQRDRHAAGEEVGDIRVAVLGHRDALHARNKLDQERKDQRTAAQSKERGLRYLQALSERGVDIVRVQRAVPLIRVADDAGNECWMKARHFRELDPVTERLIAYVAEGCPQHAACEAFDTREAEALPTFMTSVSQYRYAGYELDLIGRTLSAGEQDALIYLLEQFRRGRLLVSDQPALSNGGGYDDPFQDD